MHHLTVAKNAFYQAFARSASSLIGFIITIVIARKFGVLGYGDFTKITSYVALFYLAVDFGLNAFFIQYEKPSFKNLFYLRVIISSALFIVLNLVVFILPYNAAIGSGFSESVKFGIFIFSFNVFSQAVILSSSSIFQKTFKYFYYMVGIILGAVFNLLAVLIFVFLNFSIFYVLLAFVFGGIVSAGYMLIKTEKEILPFALDRKFSRELIIKSLPVGLMLIFNLVYFRADMFLLSLMAPTKDVGIYGLAYKFFDFLIALPLFLSNAVYPLLIKAKNETNVFLRLTKTYFFVFLVASLVIMVPFWFASPLFALIKSDFYPSIIPFRILLISLPFFFTTSFLQWVLITLEKQKYLMYLYFFSTFLNIILNVIFIPQFSYIASAVITVFSEAVVFIFLTGKILSLHNLAGKEIKINV